MKRLRRWVKITISLALGILFLWLAFRNVKIDELLSYAHKIQYGWILPFTLTVLLSHYCRAERWRLLIKERDRDPHRLTLFSGVMVGYLLNLVFPRLGEITRPVYVARREELSTPNLIGTIVLERVIDMVTLALLMAFVFVYIIADVQMLQNIFGSQTVSFFRNFFQPAQLGMLIGGLVVIMLLIYGSYRLLIRVGRNIEIIRKLLNKVRSIIRTFVNGLLAVREVERWGRFLLYTGVIWICYILMTYIPFYMFDMQQIYDLGIIEALSVTVISAVGIIIPTPGGIGTYHYFVKQSLLILFAVPAVTGLAYATVTHGVMMLVIIVSTPLVVLLERLVLNPDISGKFIFRDIKASKD